MIEVINGVCPADLFCDDCQYRWKYTYVDSGHINGVYCRKNNSIQLIKPVPSACVAHSSVSVLFKPEF